MTDLQQATVVEDRPYREFDDGLRVSLRLL